MTPSARPKVPPVAITIFTWNLFCFVGRRFKKLEAGGRTDTTCENSEYYGSTSWINFKCSAVVELYNQAILNYRKTCVTWLLRYKQISLSLFHNFWVLPDISVIAQINLWNWRLGRKQRIAQTSYMHVVLESIYILFKRRFTAIFPSQRIKLYNSEEDFISYY